MGCCGHVTAVKSELIQDGGGLQTTTQQISPCFTAGRSCDVIVTSSPAAACSPPATFNTAHGQYQAQYTRVVSFYTSAKHLLIYLHRWAKTVTPGPFNFVNIMPD